MAGKMTRWDALTMLSDAATSFVGNYGGNAERVYREHLSELKQRNADSTFGIFTAARKLANA